ncbi:phage integrase SAM-like domain-containing protein [Dysgonomonas termitidis]
MYSVNFKGKANTKNPELVRIEMILFKTGYARIPKVLSITGKRKSWNQNAQSFAGNTSEETEKNQLLMAIRLKYLKVVEQWELEGVDWSPVQWSHYFDINTTKKEVTKVKSVSVFLDELILRFKNTERIKNGGIIKGSSNFELYLSLKNSLAEFTKKTYNRSFHTYFFPDIDENFFRDYAFFLQKKGLEQGNKGGIVNRLKSLRATITHADKANIPGVNKGASVVVQDKMRIGKTTPKTIDYKYIQKIESLDLSGYSEKQRLNIDAFLFSFYAGGMSPIDVIYLTHKCFNEGKIVYERMKTTKEARMPVLKKAVDIINKYKGQCYGDYVLPILQVRHQTETQKVHRVSGFSDCVNKTLRKVAKNIGYKGKITWNSARGTYISKLIDEKYPVELVAEHAGNSPDVIYKHYYIVTQREELNNKLDSLL